jgi:Lsr2
MAQKVTAALEDDLDGGPADETVRFGLAGAEYEIDLSNKNAAAFRRTLAPFIDHARTAGRGQRRRHGADLPEPGARRQHQGVGERSWHRGQRPRPHPRERRRAIPSRYQTTLTHAGIADGPNAFPPQ